MAYEQEYKSEKYKHVYFREFDGTKRKKKPYNGRFTYNGAKYDIGWHASEREAALLVDKKLIELGGKAVNILKPKA